MKNLKTMCIVVFTIMLAALEISGFSPEGTAVAADTPEKVVWRFQSCYPPGDFIGDMSELFAKELTRRTGGRLEVKFFRGGTIVKDPVDMLRGVAQGVVDMSDSYGGYFKGQLPVGVVEGGLPFLYRGFDDLNAWRDVMYGTGLVEVFRKAYAAHGVVYAGPISYHAAGHIESKKPIRGIKELKGLKIREPGALADLWKELGARPVLIPPGDIYMALKLGTVDASSLDLSSANSYKLYEVAPYLILPPTAENGNTHIIINPKSWGALPDDIKLTFTEVMQFYYSARAFEKYSKDWRHIKEHAKEIGWKPIYLPDEDVKEMAKVAMKTIWPEYEKKDAYCKQAIEIVKKFYGYE